MRLHRSKQDGFTLLEVMIAMSILAVGAASIIGIFVAAVKWQADRVDNNTVTQIYNYAREHAQSAFRNFDPTKVKRADRAVPQTIVADFTDVPAALESKDPFIREGADKFDGFKYEIQFEENDLSVKGSSVVAQIVIYRLSGVPVQTMREILTRDGTPGHEFWRSPSKERRDRNREAGKSGR